MDVRPPRATHDSVKVIIRVRPFTPDEIQDKEGNLEPTVIPHSATEVSCADPYKPPNRISFPFDLVAWSVPTEQYSCSTVQFASQETMFAEVGIPTVDYAFEGYNGCIFAYGQTSSGKTYTMMGWDGDEGIIPRLCREMFARIDRRESQPPTKHRVDSKVTISFMEIYMEQVRDLTISKKTADSKSLPIFHDPKLGPIVKDLRHEPVKTWADVEKILDYGNRQKTVRATAMNDRSSRSHVVIQLTMTQTEVVGRVGNKEVSKTRRSRVNLIDLAGSEKILKSKVQGQAMSEAININVSLTTLGRVIDALIEKRSHVPYRESILTSMLSDSLGGNSRTHMVATLSPAQRNFEETLSTLRYAVRTRKVVNLVRVNEDAASALIRDLQKELELLRSGYGGKPQTSQEVKELQEQLRKTEEIIGELRLREQQEREENAKREEVWERQRQKMEVEHREKIEALIEEAKELEMAEADLREKEVQLEEEIQVVHRKGLLHKFRAIARAALAQHRAQCARDKSVQVKQEVTVINRQVQSVQQKIKEIHTSTVPTGPTCDMCRVAAPMYECAECNERYCPGCDAKVHRNKIHPSRCPVMQNTKIRRPCELCLIAEGSIFCRGCGNAYFCDGCDQLKHRNPKRAGHQRTTDTTTAPPPEVTSPTLTSKVPGATPLSPSHPLYNSKANFPGATPATQHLQPPVHSAAIRRRLSDGEQLLQGQHPMATKPSVAMPRHKSLPDAMAGINLATIPSADFVVSSHRPITRAEGIPTGERTTLVMPRTAGPDGTKRYGAPSNDFPQASRGMGQRI